jgi:hypothetical protein
MKYFRLCEIRPIITQYGGGWSAVGKEFVDRYPYIIQSERKVLS